MLVLGVTVSKAQAVVLSGPPQRAVSGQLTLWWGSALFLEKGLGGFICKLLCGCRYTYVYVHIPVFTFMDIPTLSHCTSRDLTRVASSRGWGPASLRAAGWE